MGTGNDKPAPVDFSSIGGSPVDAPATATPAGVDFSSVGGVPVDTGTAQTPPKKDWLSQASDFASGLWSKINPVTQAKGAANLAAHPLASYTTDATQRQALLDQAEKDFKSGDYASGVARSLYGIIPFLGPQMNESGENIATPGKRATGLGQATGMGLALSQPAIVKGAIAAPAAVADTAGAAADAASDLRATARGKLTTPKGALTPSARAGAQVVGGATGAVTGALTGHPVIGAFEGMRSGPTVLRAALGDNPPLTPEEAFNARVTKGVETAKVRAAVKAATTPAQAEAAAANSPLSEDFDPTSSVIHVPEPNAPTAGVRPGSMFSVPRTELAAAAQRGQPGALDVLKSLGRPTIVIPRGAGDFPGPRVEAPATEAAAPDFAYRVRDVGERGVPATDAPAHATTTLADAQRLAPGRESVQGKPQEIVKVDLSKLEEGKDYQRIPREGAPDWIKLKRPLREAQVAPAQ